MIDEIKFGVNRLMEKPESEDEETGAIYRAKSLISCDSPSNLSVTRTKSRSRSRSRSQSHSRSRSNSSSSSELEVDSPPPPRIMHSPLTDIPHVSHFAVLILNCLRKKISDKIIDFTSSTSFPNRLINKCHKKIQ